MPVAIFFRKTDEDSIRVVYVFGLSRKNLSRTLVIDKANRIADPGDGEIDVIFEGVTVKILRLVVVDGRWPDRGWHAV